MVQSTKKPKQSRTSEKGRNRKSSKRRLNAGTTASVVLDRIAAADPAVERPALAKRLAMRLTESDYAKLVELRFALRLGNDAETLRALIRLHHSEASKGLIRKLRREPGHEERVAAAVDRRQLPLRFS